MIHKCFHTYRHDLLREGYRLMEIKKLLRCYGIRSLALSNTRDIMVSLSSTLNVLLCVSYSTVD